MSASIRRRLLAWLLPALLLVAQQGALAHLVSHGSNRDQPDQQKKTLLHLKLCSKCHAAEKLSHSAPFEQHLLDIHACKYDIITTPPGICGTVVSRGVSCRDPPNAI